MMKQFYMYPYHWLILVIGLALLAVAIVYLVRSRRRKDEDRPAMDILKERYARGEIGREEFERMKKDLQ